MTLRTSSDVMSTNSIYGALYAKVYLHLLFIYMFVHMFIARTDHFNTLVHFTSYSTLTYIIFFFTFQVIENEFQAPVFMSFIMQKCPTTPLAAT